MAGEWVRGTISLIPNVAPNHTITNALNAIQSILVAGGWEAASWSPGSLDRYYLRADRLTQERWRYEGDGPVQHCGIHVFTNSPTNTLIRISAFLENTTGTGAQVDAFNATATVNRRGYVEISWDVTAPNNYLLICGEDGLYLEAGRDSSPTNLGHGAIVTVSEVVELNATKSTALRWTTQGFAMDLFGECRFTTARNNRFVANDGTSKNFTAFLTLYGTRGVLSTTVAPVPANFPDYPFGNRDLILGQTGVSAGSGNELRYGCTFGCMNTPEDGRYRVAPLILLQETAATDITARAATSASTSNNVAAGTGVTVPFRDIRHDRQINRFVSVDYTLLPFANLTEAQTGKLYRVIEHNDSGRTANIGIEWPSVVVTPSVT